MRVRIADLAAEDLEAIGDWIAEDNPGRAISFIDELTDRCFALSRHPRRFPVVIEADGQVLRKLTHRGYLIFYCLLADRIEIVRVVHGSRDWVSLFAEPE